MIKLYNLEENFIFLFNSFFMRNTCSLTRFENKDFNAQHVSGNVPYTSTTGNQNITNVSVGENVKTNSHLHPIR